MVPHVPAVSVCVPLYRKEAFIAEAIESVLAQTFDDFELVVLDNASTDGSAEIVRSYHDPRLVLVENDVTIPVGMNFNKVVSLSAAPLVKVLAADDLLHPTCLERQVASMNRHPGAIMVSSRHDLIDETSRVIGRDRLLRTRDMQGLQHRGTVVRRMVRHGGNPVGNTNNVVFRRWAFEAAGGFGDGDSFTLDVSLWSRLLEHGDYVGLPETLSAFRICSGSYTAGLQADAISMQRRFVGELRRANSDIVGWRDVVCSAVRSPLTRIRHHLLFAAAGPPSGVRRRTAERIIGLGSAEPRRVRVQP